MYFQAVLIDNMPFFIYKKKNPAVHWLLQPRFAGRRTSISLKKREKQAIKAPYLPSVPPWSVI
jgi:hypothetical protein